MEEPADNPADRVCDACGQHGATEMGEGFYCAECYVVIGSSCGGAG